MPNYNITSECMSAKDAVALSNKEYQRLRDLVFQLLRKTFNDEVRKAATTGLHWFRWRVVDNNLHVSTAVTEELSDFVRHLRALGYAADVTTGHSGVTNGYICAWGEDAAKLIEENM